MKRALVLVAAMLVVAPVLPACATHTEDLARGLRAFEQNSHERALAIFRSMEPDLTRLTPTERAQYAYLRGMTDYRIGYRLDARHWLSLAKAMELAAPGALPADWKSRMNEAVTELNTQVYNEGIETLTNSLTRAPEAAPTEKSGDKDKKKKPVDDEP